MSSDRDESDPFLKEEANSSIGTASPRKQISWRNARFLAVDVWSSRCRRFANSVTARTYWLPTLVFFTTSLLWGSVLLYALRRYPSSSLESHIGGTFGQENQLYGIPISEYRFLRCGTSVREAKALGCEYDILANHWVPRQCMDYEAVAEYQSDGSWFGFARENRSELLRVQEMGELPLYYTSERDHIVHCAMLWRKQYRAFAEGRKHLDSITASREHTYHCSQYLIDMTDLGQDLRAVPLEVNVGFAGCYIGE
ncbi:hypothetical protein V8F06_004453 [Rhypophila decipiens]